MKYYRAGIVLLVWALASYQAGGQDVFMTLYGKVTDAQNGQPIPFASIQLKGSGTGTASNVLGEFIFKIREKHAVDTLLVSCIGYKTMVYPLRQSGTRVINLRLEPATVVLKEVTVNPKSGFDILKEAFARIPENYDTSDVQLTAFYQESILLGEKELAFNEAVLDVYRVFYENKERPDQIKVIKGRKKDIQQKSDQQFYYWISNISNGARGTLGEGFFLKDIGHKRNTFSQRNFRYYECEYRESIHEGNRNLIVLDMFPRKNSRKGLLRLKIFLDEESLAIVRIEYETTPAGIDWVNRRGKGGLAYIIMSKVIRATLDFSRLTASVSYKQYNGKWYLNDVKRHWDVLLNSKKRNMKDTPWTSDMSLLITDIQTENVKRFSEGDIVANRSSMGNIIGGEYDEAFWENYNIVKPVLPDSLKNKSAAGPVSVLSPSMDKVPAKSDSSKQHKASNRQNGFTRGDTLRGTLSALRSCYDVTFYHLDAAINMDERSVKGSNTMRFKVTAPFRMMQVDLYANMKIEKIIFKGQPLSFTREYDAVFVKFPGELKRGEQAEIKFYYEGVPKVPDFSIPMNGGILWDKDSLGNAWAQVVCQGSGASLWWPNKDHLSDEPDSMKIWITVPSAFTEVSNGRLIRKTPMPSNQTRYEWFVSYPINNYNVTFSIGKYAHWTDRYIDGDTLTIDYYVMPYNVEHSKVMFQQVKPMLACFEKSFGKYPFLRDGFTLVESPYPMEHQSGVCIGKITQENSGDTNPLLWHESAHEWWGNAISCKDIADMWFHEAFATYAEAQVVECTYGKEEALNFINGEQGRVNNREPVIGVYGVNHIYYDIADMYSKGSLMLNTFRSVLDNDSIWFDLLLSIQQHFRYQTLTSDELVRYINQHTHTDYTYFFDQYLKHTEVPKLELDLKDQQSNLVVKYRWQANVRDFRMPVKVTTSAGHFEFIYPTSSWKTITLQNITSADFEVDEDGFFIDVLD